VTYSNLFCFKLTAEQAWRFMKLGIEDIFVKYYIKLVAGTL